jgi:hypothetical protein
MKVSDRNGCLILFLVAVVLLIVTPIGYIVAFIAGAICATLLNNRKNKGDNNAV